MLEVTELERGKSQDSNPGRLAIAPILLITINKAV